MIAAPHSFGEIEKTQKLVENVSPCQDLFVCTLTENVAWKSRLKPPGRLLPDLSSLSQNELGEDVWKDRLPDYSVVSSHETDGT